MKKPKSKDIPKAEEILRFWNHLKILRQEKKIKRRDFIIIGLLIFKTVRKIDIIHLTIDDVNLNQQTISIGIKLKKIPEDLVEPLARHIHILKQFNKKRLFNISYRQIYNIFARRTKVFFDRPIGSSVFNYV